MSVAYDGSGTAGVTTGGGYTTSLNLTTYTAGSGANRVLYAAVTLQSASSSPTMTWNGVSLTLIDTMPYRAGGDNQYLFRLINPASGNQTLAVSWTGADAGSVDIACFSGADQTTPNGTVGRATGTSTAPSSGAVTSGANDATVAFAAVADHSGGVSAFSAGSENQTNVYRGTSTLEANQSLTYAIGGSSNTHDFTSTNHAWGVQSFRILEASGGAPANTLAWITA